MYAALGERKSRSIVGDQVDGLVVMLAETVKADARVVPLGHRIEHDLRAGILRPSVLRGADRRVIRIAVVIGAIVVVERRNREEHAGPEGVRPGQASERVALPFHVADARILCVRIVGDLIVVAPQGGHEAELVVRVAIVDERPHAAQAPHAIVQDLGTGSFQAIVAPIAVDAAEIGELLACGCRSSPDRWSGETCRRS